MNNKTAKRVLVTDSVHPCLLDGLSEMDFEINYQPNISYKKVFEIIKDFDGVVINSKVKMTQELMRLAPKLKFIARLGSGLEIIDLIYAANNNIAVFSAPEGNRNAVAEHALGMLLALANNFLKADQDVRNFSWDREARRGFEIEGKTIGIIGFGNNGSCFAEKLKGFGVQVKAYDKYKKNYARHLDFVEETSLEDLIHSSDIISLHVPLDDNTHYLIDDNFISKCKDGVIMINSARGKVIKTEDLISGLERGKIGGACLDVFENEKTATYNDAEYLMYNRLYKLNNVILTPHVAGWTTESKYKIAISLEKQIRNLATSL